MLLHIVSDGGFALQVTRRGSDDVLAADGSCMQKLKGLLCRVDAKDGGSVRVVPSGRDGALLYLDDRIQVTVTDSDGPAQWLSAGKDDDVFQLNRVAERACRGM